jgi:hypothetical protein
LICREQCVWLGQEMMLGSRGDMDDIARAFEKVYKHRDALARAHAEAPGAAVST